MSRNPLIEAIHEARYDLQTCAEKDKPAARAKLYGFLAQAGSKRSPWFHRKISWTLCTMIIKSSDVSGAGKNGRSSTINPYLKYFFVWVVILMLLLQYSRCK
jgi:hypothetical protein